MYRKEGVKMTNDKNIARQIVLAQMNYPAGRSRRACDRPTIDWQFKASAIPNKSKRREVIKMW